MSKNKRSHRRSEAKSDESEGQSSSEQSSSSADDNSAVEHKKRHHKKSKKIKKHKSRKKETSSESESNSSDSESSSEEEVVKRKKQKKHKKNKRRHRHDDDVDVAAVRHSADDDLDIKVTKESQKVHYVSSGDDERHHKKSKRLDDSKRPRGPAFEEKEVKSKWDSPTDEYERKRYKEDRERVDRGRAREIDDHPDIRRRSDSNRHRRSRSHEYPNRMRNDDRKQRADIDADTRNLSRQRDDLDMKYRKRSSKSRSESQSNDLKRARNQDYDRDNRDGNRGRFNSNRAQGRGNGGGGFENKRSFSPQQRGEFHRNRGSYNENRRFDNGRRPNFINNDNRRGGEAPGQGNNYNRRDNYRKEFNDGPNNDRPGNYNNRRPYEPRANDDRESYRPNERQWRDQSRGGGSNNNGGGPPRTNWKNQRSPARSNPFRRNDDGPGGLNTRKFDNNHRDDRRDYRHGEHRPERSERRSPARARGHSRSHSSSRRENHNRNRSISPIKRNYPLKRNSDDESYEWGGKQSEKNKDSAKEESIEKEKPNFGLSGKLTEDVNKVNGVVVKYAEPPEARKPKRRWRLYPFKGDKSLQTLYIHRQSCYLIGRDKKVCDLPVDHPSCSKQHAALQYRLVPQKKDDGTVTKRVRPYVLDMESANGTFLNNKKIEPKKYFELFEKDVLKFGFSSREYVLLHEHSNEDYLDDGLVNDDGSVKAEPNDD